MILHRSAVIILLFHMHLVTMHNLALKVSISKVKTPVLPTLMMAIIILPYITLLQIHCNVVYVSLHLHPLILVTKHSACIYTYTASRPCPYQIVILNINMYTCTRMFINLRILKSRTISAASLLFNHFHQRAKRVEFLPVCRLNGAF